mmetsp:Transcript_136/g.305  ORF Transcript_136/g.305 Transcript_136/m.305 type:complete len:213 (+) Transcript_136:863-1501(+)
MHQSRGRNSVPRAIERAPGLRDRARRLPERPPHGRGRRGARRGLPRRIGSQILRAHGDRIPVGKIHAAGGPAALPGRRRDDRHGHAGGEHLRAAPGEVRGGDPSHRPGGRDGSRGALRAKSGDGEHSRLREGARAIPRAPYERGAGGHGLRASSGGTEGGAGFFRHGRSACERSVHVSRHGRSGGEGGSSLLPASAYRTGGQSLCKGFVVFL